jgi:hypothetical protein
MRRPIEQLAPLGVRQAGSSIILIPALSLSDRCALSSSSSKTIVPTRCGEAGTSETSMSSPYQANAALNRFWSACGSTILAS